MEKCYKCGHLFEPEFENNLCKRCTVSTFVEFLEEIPVIFDSQIKLAKNELAKHEHPKCDKKKDQADQQQHHSYNPESPPLDFGPNLGCN